jgi:transcriptional regulator with XRE-family HTH domain
MTSSINSYELTRNRGRPTITTMDARGIIIRERRKALDLTMLQTATRAGVTEATISRIEAGKMPNASLDTWVKVCDALDLDITDLVKPRVPTSATPPRQLATA